MNNKFPFFFIVTFVVLVISISSTQASATANHDFSIANAEQVNFTKNTLNNSDSSNQYLSFSAFNQEFNLVLQENSKLADRFSSKNKKINLFTGKIQGNEKSWARLTVFGEQYTGAVFNGNELFILDIGQNINAALHANANMQSIKTVIYKSSEVSSDLKCADHEDHAEHDHAFSYKNLLSEQTRKKFSPGVAATNSVTESSSDLEIAAATAFEQINLRIITDTQYTASSDLDAEVQVLSQMNIVDGIFSEQVGVQFGITDIEVLSDNGSLLATDASDLLTQFRTFVGNDNPGLAHLFTGRNLDSNTIGIAFVRGICRTSGVGLTQAGGRGTLGALTAAHEFGHNFGAPHDNQEGSVCLSTAGTFLMNPSLNGSDQFSQCSLDQISNTLVGAQCLVPVDNEPLEPAENCSLSADFTQGPNDFVFVNDSQAPLYSTGSTLAGNLSTTLGGVDNNDISNIEGVWSRQCLSETGGNMTFELNASLSQSAEYEADEFSQIAIRINDTIQTLETLTGDGNGGISPNTGNQQYSVTLPLNSGTNNIELVCFNNLKTFANETTQCNFNSLESRESTVSNDQELCFPIKNKNSVYAMICL